MTDDRARRLRDLRKRTASDEDEGTKDDESADDSTAPTDGETSDETTGEDSDSDESSQESANGDERGGAELTDGEDESGGEDDRVDFVDETAATDDDREELSYDETDGTAQERPQTGDTPRQGAEEPAPADENEGIDPALQGAIADTSSMVATTETIGGEPTVDASVLSQETDDVGRASTGRGSAMLDQGDSLLHSTHDREDTIQMLELFLNESRYAIEIERISAIVEMKDITRFPRGPDAIDGVTDLRGEITGVLDPTTMLDVEQSELSDDQYIVVLKRSDDKQKLGVRVTDVSQAVTYPKSQIDETGAVMDLDSENQHEFIKGIIKKNVDEETSLITWLDVDAIIENTE
ncbi:chemotaxis protein CheW [Natrarchaeobius halalkaliphilus]|uniref:Chemotaxis protein CheW n=1 Tax=Natrarchaeobius halalkaliphilus TaxID=1679091 RepID=A0A3N6LK74_9EURY|nr:chemotaxis protein CheW [Natrarchaeobius halalkaliphilus]RQG86768.1 chemotaxis protein CheW [Natrarchaeobius halalkaliphilus]